MHHVYNSSKSYFSKNRINRRDIAFYIKTERMVLIQVSQILFENEIYGVNYGSFTIKL